MEVKNPKLEHYPKTVPIRNNKEVVIRPMAKDDFDRVSSFFRALPKEDTQFLRNDVSKPDTVKRWFTILDYAKRLPLMALHNDEIVGHALLDAAQPTWSPHVAEIRVVVAHDYKKHAVGTVLAREIFDQAMSRGFDKVVAQVMMTQIAAKKMFSRMGFTVEAELKDHVKDLDGKKHNLLIMSCVLDDAWAKMDELLQDFSPWVGWR